MGRPGVPFCKASAVWQWANFWEARGRPARVTCFLNLDETSIPLLPSPSPAKGFLALRTGETVKRRTEQERRASLSERRSAVSFVAMIADQPEVQALLPQVLVGSSKVVPAATAADFVHRGDQIFLLRRKSGWLNVDCLCRLLRLFLAAVKDVRSKYNFVLALDACPVHIHQRVIDVCVRNDVQVIFIAAGCTSVLQPLDTAGFAAFKLRYRQAFEEALLRSAQDHLTVAEVLSAVCTAIQEKIIGKQWRAAFRQCGFGGSQGELSHGLLRKLQLAAAPAVGSNLLTLRQLQVCFPRRASVPIVPLFRSLLPRERPRTHARGTAECSDAPRMPLEPEPWVLRLRRRVHPAAKGGGLPRTSGPSTAAASASSSSHASPSCPPMMPPPRRTPSFRNLALPGQLSQLRPLPPGAPLPAAATEPPLPPPPLTAKLRALPPAPPKTSSPSTSWPSASSRPS